jgi:hypothetical protein
LLSRAETAWSNNLEDLFFDLTRDRAGHRALEACPS